MVAERTYVAAGHRNLYEINHLQTTSSPIDQQPILQQQLSTKCKCQKFKVGGNPGNSDLKQKKSLQDIGNPGNPGNLGNPGNPGNIGNLKIEENVCDDEILYQAVAGLLLFGRLSLLCWPS